MWYKTNQYLNDVMISIEEQKILMYVHEFLTNNKLSNNPLLMYQWNSNPDFNSLSQEDQVILLVSELYQKLNSYFILCEQMKHLKEIIKDFVWLALTVVQKAKMKSCM